MSEVYDWERAGDFPEPAPGPSPEPRPNAYELVSQIKRRELRTELENNFLEIAMPLLRARDFKQLDHVLREFAREYSRLHL